MTVTYITMITRVTGASVKYPWTNQERAPLAVSLSRAAGSHQILAGRRGPRQRLQGQRVEQCGCRVAVEQCGCRVSVSASRSQQVRSAGRVTAGWNIIHYSRGVVNQVALHESSAGDYALMSVSIAAASVTARPLSMESRSNPRRTRSRSRRRH